MLEVPRAPAAGAADVGAQAARRGTLVASGQCAAGVLRAAGGARLVPLRRRGETRDRGELALTVGTLWRFPPPKPLP